MPMIPLHILTGFLGSGKTTLLARMLEQPAGERIAVLVNEAGDLALDHLLLERIDEDVLALASGCACCTVRGELYQAIERVLALGPTRIVLETTGLADPAPILHGLATDPRLAGMIHVAGVIAVVDASRIDTLLDEQPEVGRQLEFADRVVMTKGDLVPERVAIARQRLAEAAPGRELRDAVHGDIDAAWLLTTTPLGGVRTLPQAERWLHHGRHAAAFRTHALKNEDPARVDLLDLWLRLVTQLDGARLLRVKALVECAQSGEIYVLQSAGHAVFPPRRLERRPTGLRGVRMVLIERGLQDSVVEQLLGSLRSALAAEPRA